jgi:hypothetical protein
VNFYDVDLAKFCEYIRQDLITTGYSQLPGVARSSQIPRPHFKTRKSMVMGPNGSRNQDSLCWRGSARPTTSKLIHAVTRVFGR